MKFDFDVKKEEAILAGRVIPPVRSLKLVSDKFFKIADKAKFEVFCPEEGAADFAAGLARSFWKVEAKVSAAKTGKYPDNDEGYSIRISAAKVAVSAKTLRGVRYAFYSLRQLAETERGVLTSTAMFLPCVEIEDFPGMPFRGMHFCFFPVPETTYVEMEHNIRMAAYFKMNYAVIESWGALEYQSHPEFCWSDRALKPGEMKRLVKLGKELGITLIPQLNIFGHATAARSSAHKHALLDHHPEFAPLFEPDGWCWCLSNPETRKYLTDIVEELCDIFDNPPFFHLGCDEAEGAGTCSVCRRQDYTKLLEDHLLYFNGLLKKRNSRPMIWHDMFLDRDDRRWDNYIVNGNREYAELARKLPKDFVICDWQYGYPDEAGKLPEPTWATTKHFIKEGFDTLVSPWTNIAGIMGLGKVAEAEKGFGMLETTWHINRGNVCSAELNFGAWASWNPRGDAPNRSHTGLNPLFASCLRQVQQDMHLSKYEDIGTTPYQVHGPFFEHS